MQAFVVSKGEKKKPKQSLEGQKKWCFTCLELSVVVPMFKNKQNHYRDVQILILIRTSVFKYKGCYSTKSTTV